MPNKTTIDNTCTAERGPLAIRTNINRAEAWQVIESKLPGSKRMSVAPSHHPFFAFEYDIIVKHSSVGRVGILVDAVGGAVSTVSEWPTTRWLSDFECSSMRHVVLDTEAARIRARRAAASRVMRKLKIWKLFTLSETRVISTLWKPNWIVHAAWRAQYVHVLVDGLDGSYYVVSVE